MGNRKTGKPCTKGLCESRLKRGRIEKAQFVAQLNTIASIVNHLNVLEPNFQQELHESRARCTWPSRHAARGIRRIPGLLRVQWFMWKTFKRKEETKKQKLQAAFFCVKCVWCLLIVFLSLFVCCILQKSHKNTTKTGTECNKNTRFRALEWSSRRRTDHGGSGALLHLLRFSSCFFVDSSPRLTCCSPVALLVCPRHHSDLRGLCHLCQWNNTQLSRIEHHWYGTKFHRLGLRQLSFSLPVTWRKSQGVSLTHGNLLAYVRWHVQYYQLSHEDETRSLCKICGEIEVKHQVTSVWAVFGLPPDLVSLWGPCATHGGSLLWCFHGGLRAARFWGVISRPEESIRK